MIGIGQIGKGDDHIGVRSGGEAQGLGQVLVDLSAVGKGVHLTGRGGQLSALVELIQGEDQIVFLQAEGVPDSPHEALDAAGSVVVFCGAVVEQTGFRPDAGVPAVLGLAGDVQVCQIVLHANAQLGAEQRSGSGQLLLVEDPAAPIAPGGHQVVGIPRGDGGVHDLVEEIVAQNGSAVFGVAAFGLGTAPAQQLQRGGIDPAQNAHTHAAEAGVDDAVIASAGFQGPAQGDPVFHQLIQVDAVLQGGLFGADHGDQARAQTEHKQHSDDFFRHRTLTFWFGRWGSKRKNEPFGIIS